MSEEVTLTIDGRSVSVPKGTLIVEAARKLGIEIPVYCYHPKLDPVGACRVCVVDVEGQRRPIMPACATEVAPNMVVHTRNEAATRAREGVIELLLINHPLDCPVCDRGGECDLQDFTLRYGPGRARFQETKRHFAKSVTVGREVVLDRERCIMCMRCVRFCDEIPMEQGLTIIERGTKSEIGPFPGQSFDSQFSGNTVEICPVGALTSRSYRFKGRPWELQNFASVCNHCAVGCNVTVDVRYNEVARVRSRCNDAIDDGWLCDKGRYGFGFIRDPSRVLAPMVRKDGKLQEVSWTEALDRAAEGLRKYKGADFGAVAGPRLSNEGGWLLTRFVRSLMESPNLDHRRSGELLKEGKPLPLTAKIEALDQATAVVVADCDLLPVLELRVKKALRRGAELIVVGKSNLDAYADFRVDSLDSLQAELERGEEPEPAGLKHPAPRPWEPGGSTRSDLRGAALSLRQSPRVVMIFSENHPTEGLEKLAQATGCLGQAPFGLLMQVSGANAVGLREMGVLPMRGPGWQDLASAASSLSEAWGSFQQDSGLDYAALTRGSGVKALLMVAEDRLAQKPEFLISIDLFLNEASSQADVFLPASSFVEQTMTMTSLDGTVQLCRQALPSQGESQPDWQILLRLARALGQSWSTDSATSIYAEIGRLNPLYAGSSYRDFQAADQVHWSYPAPGKIGTPRPDLAGIPVQQPDATPWKLAPPTGSRVERVARLLAGDHPPAVPGQDDPRDIAARLPKAARLEEEAVDSGGQRASVGSAPQPPGPSPAGRYHTIGMGFREEPQGATLVKEAVEETPVAEEASS